MMTYRSLVLILIFMNISCASKMVIDRPANTFAICPKYEDIAPLDMKIINAAIKSVLKEESRLFKCSDANKTDAIVNLNFVEIEYPTQNQKYMAFSLSVVGIVVPVAAISNGYFLPPMWFSPSMKLNIEGNLAFNNYSNQQNYKQQQSTSAWFEDDSQSNLTELVQMELTRIMESIYKEK